LFAAAPDCEFCRYAVDVQTAGSFAKEGVDLWALAGGQSDAPWPASFGEWAAAPMRAGIEPNTAVAAPAPEISTAAMLALGAVVLTARARRKSRPAWKTVWMAPGLAETL
jgi:hypothetical protein